MLEFKKGNQKFKDVHTAKEIKRQEVMEEKLKKK